MKRKLLILFIALLAIACNGQQSSKENVKPLTEQEALKAFKKQKHRFEIKGYKIYYNDQLMKLDTIANFFDTFGNTLHSIVACGLFVHPRSFRNHKDKSKNSKD